jgi:hypothetical protein
LHFGAWVILGVLGPTLGGEVGRGGGGLIAMMQRRTKNRNLAFLRDERPKSSDSSTSSSNKDDAIECGEKRGDKSPDTAFPDEEQQNDGEQKTIGSSSSSQRSVFGIAARTCAAIALARAIRMVSFMLTVVPNPKSGCYQRQFSDAPKQYDDGWHLITYGSNRIRGTGGCNDLIFSGHGVIYMSGFLCVATHGISLGSFVVFFAVLHVSCKEALDQTHYSVDMFLAVAVTALSWRECKTVERWVTGNSKEGRGGNTVRGEAEENTRGKFQLSERATRVVSFCLPFLIVALVIAGAAVFITSDV